MTDAEIERRILDQTRDSAERTAAAASDAEEALGDVIAEARELRKKIASGVVSPDDARHALAELRQRHKEIAAHLPSIKIVYESFISDPTVPAGVRLKAAQDLADRAGLAAAQVHKIVPSADDPVLRFFEGVFSDPSNWESNPPPDPTPAIESYATSSLEHHDVEPEEILEAELIDDAERGNDTPPRVAEMIKSGAFDRKPGQ